MSRSSRTRSTPTFYILRLEPGSASQALAETMTYAQIAAWLGKGTRHYPCDYLEVGARLYYQPFSDEAYNLRGSLLSLDNIRGMVYLATPTRLPLNVLLNKAQKHLVLDQARYRRLSANDAFYQGVIGPLKGWALSNKMRHLASEVSQAREVSQVPPSAPTQPEREADSTPAPDGNAP